MPRRLDNKQYQQAKSIAMAALELPGEQRADWILQQCDNNRALIDEVNWLIQAAEDASEDHVPEQFQAATRKVVREVSLKVPLPRDYRLIRRLNEGGSGVVYLAERIDGDLRQPVALKLLQLTETPDEALTRRFATERQILSRLSHPNIAHLIDGGLTAEGRPFLATEFVDGQRIDQWCDCHQATLKQRIELFLKVISAVDYAHRHMVIHRDLKPPNILVSAEGEPKLLDFGIAHLLDASGRGERTAETIDQALTLHYASPEQIEGNGLNAATDVYSLGVVLYELISGHRPFDHIQSSHLLPQAILAGVISPPSRRARMAIASTVRTDLDAIVMKALRTDPAERYLSVRELGEDLERLLEHRPVLARRGRLFYRAQRYAWRHRFGLAAAVAVIALIITFMMDREAQLQRIAWERDRAEAVTEFMTELFAGADSLPSRGNEVTVREILDLGAGQLDSDQALNPAFMGSIHLALGSAYNALGLGEQALPLLTQARRALSSAASVQEQAMIQAEIASALDSGGRAVEAIAADEVAIELFRSTPENFRQEILKLQIRKLRNHANVLDRPLSDTIDDLKQIIDEIDQANQAMPELHFEALSALVGAYVIQGAQDVALEVATSARDLADGLWEADDPRRLRGQFVYATALMLSNPDAAIPIYQSLIEDHERLIGPGQRLANTIGNLGVALSRVGRNRDSIEAFERSAAMIVQVADRDHYLYRLSVSNLAALHLRQGDPLKAEQMIGEIIDDLAKRAQAQGGVEAVYHASALDILGSALSLQGRLNEAADIYRQAIAILDNDELGSQPALRTTIATRLAEVERQQQLDGW